MTIPLTLHFPYLMNSKISFLSLALIALCGCATNPTSTYESEEDATLTKIAGGDNKPKNIVVVNSFKNHVNGKLMAKAEIQTFMRWHL